MLSTNLAPAREEYLDRHALTRSEVARAGGVLNAGNGWQLRGGVRSLLEVGFVDLDDPENADLPAPPWGNLAAEARRPVKLAQHARVPVTWQLFARGQETLEVQVADVASPLARVWADAVVAQGTTVRAPLGRGFAAGPTAVIDGGARLMRATYDDGVAAAELDESQTAQRLVALQDQARKILHELA